MGTLFFIGSHTSQDSKPKRVAGKNTLKNLLFSEDAFVSPLCCEFFLH